MVHYWFTWHQVIYLYVFYISQQQWFTNGSRTCHLNGSQLTRANHEQWFTNGSPNNDISLYLIG